MVEFRDLVIGDIDAFITSGTFFVGIFMTLLQNHQEADKCFTLFCSIHGVFLSITTLSWLFLVAFSFMYRIHHKRINRIIVITTHILLRLSVLSSIISVNLTMWYEYEKTIGKIAGLFTAIFTSTATFGMVIIYFVDLLEYNRKRKERENSGVE